MHRAWTIGWFRDAEQSRLAHAARETNVPILPGRTPESAAHDTRRPAARNA